jgi:hypothetical protein
MESWRAFLVIIIIIPFIFYGMYELVVWLISLKLIGWLIAYIIYVVVSATALFLIDGD